VINQIINGDCLEVLKTLPANSVDALVTDPPSGISFMGAEWDSNKGGRKQWVAWLTQVMEEVYRVLKPGGHGVVWALPRTSHWTATALEDAGFEIRDCIVHHFGSGFPKSLNVSKQLDHIVGSERGKIRHAPRPITSGTIAGKTDTRPSIEKAREVGYHETDDNTPISDLAKQYDGFGTALKPSSEFWWLVRKPLERGLSVAANVTKWGCGAINIGACRIDNGESTLHIHKNGNVRRNASMHFASDTGATVSTGSDLGRWPSNLLLSHSLFCVDTGCDPSCPIAAMDAQSGELSGQGGKNATKNKLTSTINKNASKTVNHTSFDDSGGASRFFPNFSYSPEELDELYFMFRYIAKPSQAERNSGLDSLPEAVKVYNGQSGQSSKDIKPIEERFTTVTRNTHPTVKSFSLMSWLCKLVGVPGGVILDPFTGSGSTLVAAYKADFNYIGIEREPLYCEIAQLRVDGAKGLFKFSELEEVAV
jgi:site-specific DNA-methyltransferase (adenine-specific)